MTIVNLSDVHSRNLSIQLPVACEVDDDAAVYVPYKTPGQLRFASIGAFCRSLDIPIPDFLHALSKAETLRQAERSERLRTDEPVRNESGARLKALDPARARESARLDLRKRARR